MAAIEAANALVAALTQDINHTQFCEDQMLPPYDWPTAPMTKRLA